MTNNVPYDSDLNKAILEALSVFSGYCNTICWSFMFYPQMITNYTRKSAEGLSFDFIILNTIGNICYLIFNLSLFSSKTLTENYIQNYHLKKIPVGFNDILFSIHAKDYSLIPNMKRGTFYIILGVFSFIFLLIILNFINPKRFTILFVLSCIGNIKVCCGLLKYIPQCLLNYQRKSTEGINIVGLVFDMSGGLFCIVQMFILALISNNFIEFYGIITLSSLSPKLLSGIIATSGNGALLYQAISLYPATSIKPHTEEDEIVPISTKHIHSN
ncbi:hypothetical protein ABK040_000567 [Willaertia magna]